MFPACKMAALCQEKVRQRLVTLGKIRQEKKSEKARRIGSKESKCSACMCVCGEGGGGRGGVSIVCKSGPQM